MSICAAFYKAVLMHSLEDIDDFDVILFQIY